MHISDIHTLAQRLRDEIGKVIVGQKDTLDLMLTALFSGGHMLLEGPPGTAKTLLARTFAQSLSLRYGRIQFTPDMLPGDVLGSNLFNFQTSAFSLSKGPIFCDLLLADEINRTPPKTQAALLEAMQERHVTLDGVRHDLGAHFTVIATQNPIEQQGTYPLPEAQLDRFLFKHILGYPSQEEERRIIETSGNASASPDPATAGITAVLTPAALTEAIDTVAAIRLNDANLDYIVALIRATRETAQLSVGASPRAGALLARAARAYAVLDGRDYVLPDDIKTLYKPCMRHRVLLSPSAEIEGLNVDGVLQTLLETIEIPR
ncbi:MULTISPECIES: MoxR family ATPase [Asticcacaulis]|uniref:AAA family ATPase n=1 Tax=Asticcacaulis TaxID=76890 RepID=UPI001AE2C46C|nr:MoxR family ATPase [Asticcacaulis sp. BE141]MBP2161080.1 MoxR-like ATPase [Asticcacaulis solisilvae]MDR6802125.1 MoxR-like ATPase [Asticcacaulis sp. BE141]